MLAVIESGKNQYKVAEGDVIHVDRMSEEEGKSVTFDKVLMIINDKDVNIGQPYVKGAKVSAKVVKHFAEPRVIAFKYRIRKDSAVKRGSRHQKTVVAVGKISI